MARSLDSQAAPGREERTMKIDAYRSEISTETANGVGRPTTQAGQRDGANSSKPAPSADEVRLSSGAQLMQSVMQSAQQAMEVRPEVVQRMRAALANGTVGNDPHALADAILDRLAALSTPDDDVSKE
jgi:flagellar biosynthesis anti-sigma factor FlgM